MNALDLLIALPLVWALWRGFRDGIIVQLLGLAGLIGGIWLAFRYGRQAGTAVGIEAEWAAIAGFILVLTAAIVVAALSGKLLRKLFHLAGIGFADKLGGALLSLAKVALAVSLLLYGFTLLNDRYDWVERQRLEKSALYDPVMQVRQIVFPYLASAGQQLLSAHDSPN